MQKSLLFTDNPPADAVPLLHAVWYGLRGKWEAAHQIAQDDTSAEGAWVHAWLHRIEGDSANARYWYRRRPPAGGGGGLRLGGKKIWAVVFKCCATNAKHEHISKCNNRPHRSVTPP